MTLLAIVTCQVPDSGPAGREWVEARLAGLGLRRWLNGRKGRTALPCGTYAGEFEDRGLPAVESLQQQLTDEVGLIMLAAGARVEVFVSVSDTWSWHVRPIPGRRKAEPASLDVEPAMPS